MTEGSRNSWQRPGRAVLARVSKVTFSFIYNKGDAGILFIPCLSGLMELIVLTAGTTEMTIGSAQANGLSPLFIYTPTAVRSSPNI